MAAKNSYVGKGGSSAFGGSQNKGSLMYGAVRNTISRKQAANLARSRGVGGKGG